MRRALLYVFDNGEEFKVNINLHPQVEKMLGADIGTEAHYVSWSAVCRTVEKAVDASRRQDMLFS